VSCISISSIYIADRKNRITLIINTVCIIMMIGSNGIFLRSFRRSATPTFHCQIRSNHRSHCNVQRLTQINGQGLSQHYHFF
jgi:hypothetical protein